MDALFRDLRYVWRALTRTPGFFVVTVATLGLGIGATTAIFSVVDGVLLRPLPYPHSERIVEIWQVDRKGHDFNFSDLNVRDVAADSRSLEAIAEFADNGTVSVAMTRDALRARAATVSRDFFRVLGVQPMLGRIFVPDEQRVGAAPAVLISHGFWQRAFGGTGSALGATLTMGDQAFHIVGVM